MTTQNPTFTFSFASGKITTGLLNGNGSTSIKVPGVFGGIIPADPTMGRYIQSAMIYSSSPQNGDQITQLQLVDTDGVVPAQVRPSFPNYPVILDLLDTVNNIQGFYIPSAGITLQVFDSSGNPASRFIPSGLYFAVTIQNGNGSGVVNFYINIRWGVWQ